MMDDKIQRIYYSPKGYWRGLAAVMKLAAAAKVSEADTRSWLKKQAIWQMYLPAPRYIPLPMFDEGSPNAVHQADLLYLSHDRVGRRTYKYALTVVDVASRYKEAVCLPISFQSFAVPLTSPCNPVFSHLYLSTLVFNLV